MSGDRHARLQQLLSLRLLDVQKRKRKRAVRRTWQRCKAWGRLWTCDAVEGETELLDETAGAALPIPDIMVLCLAVAGRRSVIAAG